MQVQQTKREPGSSFNLTVVVKPLIATASLLAVFVAGSGAVPQDRPVPTGVGDGMRATMGVGGTFAFKKLKIVLLASPADARVATPDDPVRLRLEEGDATEVVTVQHGVSLNWHGYHVAIVAVHAANEPGGEGVDLSVATVASLPQCIGKPIGKDSPWPCR